MLYYTIKVFVYFTKDSKLLLFIENAQCAAHV